MESPPGVSFTLCSCIIHLLQEQQPDPFIPELNAEDFCHPNSWAWAACSGSTEGSCGTQVKIEAALWACPWHNELKNSQVMGNTVKTDAVHHCLILCATAVPHYSVENSLSARRHCNNPKMIRQERNVSAFTVWNSRLGTAGVGKSL